MNCRPYGSKTTIGFWTLIAIADAALLVAAIGPVVVLLILAGFVLLAGGVVAARLLTRPRLPQARLVAQPRLNPVLAPRTQRGMRAAEAVVRRRA